LIQKTGQSAAPRLSSLPAIPGAGPFDHHRGDGRRKTEKGDIHAGHAAWRWHGLLIIKHSTRRLGPDIAPGLFIDQGCWAQVLKAHSSGLNANQGNSNNTAAAQNANGIQRTANDPPAGNFGVRPRYPRGLEATLLLVAAFLHSIRTIVTAKTATTKNRSFVALRELQLCVLMENFRPLFDRRRTQPGVHSRAQEVDGPGTVRPTEFTV